MARSEINVTPGAPPPPPPPAPRRAGWLSPILTPARIVLACGVAVVTDALQFMVGPLGWAGVVQALDVIAMGLTTLLVGFHVLLLPTFIIGRDLQAGRLQAVLSDYVPLERHVYAVSLPGIHLPPKVRAFIDFLRDTFGPEPYWDRLEPVRSQP